MPFKRRISSNFALTKMDNFTRTFLTISKDARAMNCKSTRRALPIWLSVVVMLLSCSDDGGGDDSSSQGSQLSPPATVSANFVDVNTLEITWSAVSGANQYEVYIDDNPEGSSPSRFAIVEAEAGTSANATDLEVSSQYWFLVKSCHSSPLDCSGFSTTALGETIPSDIAPSDFSATPGLSSVTLTWTAVDDYSYNLLRATSDCLPSLDVDDFSNYITLCSASDPSLSGNVSSGLVQSELSADTTYYYWLETVDVHDNRAYVASSATPLSVSDLGPSELIFSKFYSSGVDLAVAIDDDNPVIYVAAGNELYALDPDEGHEKWSFVAGGPISTSPLIDSAGSVYIAATTNSGNVISKVDSEGILQWSSSGDGANDGIGLRDAIALLENEEGSYLYFTNGAGEIFRSDDLSRSALQRQNSISAGATGGMAIDLYQNLYFGDSANNLIAMSKSSVVASTALPSALVTAPAIDGSLNIYFSAGRFVYSYNSFLAERWRSDNTIGAIDSSPVLSSDGRALLQAGNDALYKFATDDGDEIWSYDLGANVGENTAPVIDADGNIYLGLSSDGIIVVISDDGELVATYDSTDKSAGISTPLRLSSTGNLYFGAGDWLFAVKAEAAANTQSPWPQYKGNVRSTAFVGDSESVDASGVYARAELDNEGLNFIEDSGGNSWIIDPNLYQVGSSSMRSPELGDSELACISTSANIGGSLSFWWKVSSEQDYDFLSLSIMGSDPDDVSKVARISGNVDWQQIDGVEVSMGDEIKWCYQKDLAFSDRDDAGWLDNVQIN